MLYCEGGRGKMSTVIIGDVLKTLRSYPDASFDAALSDPPYGLNFLGMGWDKVLPPVAVWEELSRVLRLGANALIFGGTRTFHRLMVSLEDAGFTIVDVLMWLYGQGQPKSKFGLKPAYEPIVLVRNSRGSPTPLNINGCRIGVGAGGLRRGEPSRDKRYTDRGTTNFAAKPGPRGGDVRGRWPANVILDPVAVGMVDCASGIRKSSAMRAGTKRKCCDSWSGNWGGDATKIDIVCSEGGASRFFYCPKVKGVSRIHPTQKPVELTEWLAKLLLVPSGRLIVPYAGVGSEVLGGVRAGWMDVVGIEKSSKFTISARRRCASVLMPINPL